MELLQPPGPSRAASSPSSSQKYEEENIAHPSHNPRTIAPSSFSSFQRQQDEEFYKVFPGARPDAQDGGQDWTWSSQPMLDTFTVSYNGGGAVKSWASPPTSSTLWSPAPFSTESFSTVRSYSLEGALVPATPAVIDTAGSPPDSESSLAPYSPNDLPSTSPYPAESPSTHGSPEAQSPPGSHYRHYRGQVGQQAPVMGSLQAPSSLVDDVHSPPSAIEPAIPPYKPLPMTPAALAHPMVPSMPSSPGLYYNLNAGAPPPTIYGPRRIPKDSEKRKPNLACLFCRGRKIACSAPPSDAEDRTCNQCKRRHLTCTYPEKSRRGMRQPGATSKKRKGSRAAAGSLLDSPDSMPTTMP